MTRTRTYPGEDSLRNGHINHAEMEVLESNRSNKHNKKRDRTTSLTPRGQPISSWAISSISWHRVASSCLLLDRVLGEVEPPSF